MRWPSLHSVSAYSAWPFQPLPMAPSRTATGVAQCCSSAVTVPRGKRHFHPRRLVRQFTDRQTRQSIGAGCGITLARAIARDVYGASELVKAIAYLTMFFALGGLLAPGVGGFLVDQAGWRSVFLFASSVGLAIAIAAFFRRSRNSNANRYEQWRVDDRELSRTIASAAVLRTRYPYWLQYGHFSDRRNRILIFDEGATA